MTCIVGLIDDEKVYIAGDRLASTASGMKYHLKEKKIWQKGPEMIFGAAGSSRGAQLLAYTSQIPDKTEKQSIEEYLTLNFVDAMKTALHCGGELHDKDGIETHFNHFILGYRGRLFSFFTDMGFAEVTEKYTAVGSGASFALGSLYSTENTEMSSEDRINLALEASQHYNAYVEGPYDIVSIDKEKKDPTDNMMDRILDKANEMMKED